MQVRDWDLGDGGEVGNKDKRYLFLYLGSSGGGHAEFQQEIQSSSNRDDSTKASTW
jgi:hypothetical protein